jgi:hypothetical protein
MGRLVLSTRGAPVTQRSRKRCTCYATRVNHGRYVIFWTTILVIVPVKSPRASRAPMGEATMATVVFLCPNFADDGTADNGHSYDESVACLACQQLHFLNKASGKCWGCRRLVDGSSAAAVVWVFSKLCTVGTYILSNEAYV